MQIRAVTLVISAVLAQAAHSATAADLPVNTTVPIVFTSNVDANHAHVGDAVHARATQVVDLPGGEELPSGALITGHVVAATPFMFHKTPYAKQRESRLSIGFDTVTFGGQSLPLNVYVRAIADPISSWDARKPKPSDEDSLGTVTQIGGDLLTPSQKEVISQDGEVVGYNRHGGVYAHLIAASGNSPNGCDASDTEESMGLFSASACGLYGFTGTTLQGTGKAGEPSQLVLTSAHHAPKIWKNSTALLEVLPPESKIASR